MKKCLFLLLFLTILPLSFSRAQDLIDIVHLKNGDLFKGVIIENVPNDYVRIELQGGSVFTVHYSEIKKFTRERAKLEKQEDKEPSQEITTSSSEKSKTMALLLTFLVPSTGHAYAGNWGRGLIFSAGRVGGAALALFAGFSDVTNVNPYADYSRYGTYTYYSYEYETELNEWFYIGIGISLGSMVWEMIDAAGEVDKYNSRLNNSALNKIFDLNIIPGKYGSQVQFSYNF